MPKTKSAERGIVIHQTNINPDRFKAQLLIFTGTSLISIIEIMDIWTNLTNAGIHRQMCGGIILSRIQNSALSNIPPYVKRDVKFEDICSALKTLYVGAMKVS